MGSTGDAGHVAQVRLDNTPDAVCKQHAVQVLTGLRCSMALKALPLPVALNVSQTQGATIISALDCVHRRKKGEEREIGR